MQEIEKQVEKHVKEKTKYLEDLTKSFLSQNTKRLFLIEENYVKLVNDIEFIKESDREQRETMKQMLKMLPELKDLQEINSVLRQMKTWSKINKFVIKKITKFILWITGIASAIYGLFQLIDKK